MTSEQAFSITAASLSFGYELVSQQESSWPRSIEGRSRDAPRQI
jgi:hypothetical protein